MTFNEEKSEFTLTSGLKFYSWCDVLGIGSEGDVHYGYDGSLIVETGDLARFTDADRQEIATEMIRRWKEWENLGATL